MKMFKNDDEIETHIDILNKNNKFLLYAVEWNIFYLVFNRYVYHCEIMRLDNKKIIRYIKLVDKIIYKNIYDKIKRNIINDIGAYGSAEIKNNQLIFN